MKTPLVSICCIAYNHEHYIKDALDGFVMQKTTFPFEIVISDDCSKDSTRNIIAEYKAKYPELIKDVSPEKNMGATPNFLYVQSCAKGKYVAICEGDDYWIDPYKLQKQVDYMESHPDCACCAHNALLLNNMTKQIELFNKKLFSTIDYTLDTFLSQGWFTATQTLLYRRSTYHAYENLPVFIHGDYFLQINLLSDEGSYLHYDDEIMGVYRDGGWASTNYSNKEILLCDDFISLLEFYKDKTNHQHDLAFNNKINEQLQLKEQAISQKKSKPKSRSFIARIWRKIVKLLCLER